jgi:predicted oxidoreductase
VGFQPAAIGDGDALVTNQIELSLTAHEAFTNGDLAFLQERGLPPMAWSPLAGGRLLARGPQALRARLDRWARGGAADWSAVAVAWLLHHPRASCRCWAPTAWPDRPLSDALRVPMDRQTWFELYTLALGREVA